MKKNVLLPVVVTVAIVVAGSNARASAPIGNPARTLGQGNFAIGVEGSISTRPLKTDGSPIIETTYQGTTVTTPLALQTRDLEGEYNEVMLRGEIGLLSWLDVFAKVGVARIVQSCSKWNQATLVGFYKADSAFGFAWNVGAKAKVYESASGLSVGLLAQFTRYDNKEFALEVEAAGSGFKPMPIDAGVFPVVTTPITNFSLKSDTKVYQLALGLNQRVADLNVYGGAQYSLLKNTYTNRVWGYGSSGLEERKEPGNKLMSSKSLGLFMGLEYILFDHLRVGLEARFSNELGVSSSIMYAL